MRQGRKISGVVRGGLRAALMCGSALVVCACASLPNSPDTRVAGAEAVATSALLEREGGPVSEQLAQMDLDIPFTKMVLDNGLTLIVHEDNRTPTVNVQVYYHVGSKNEPKGRSGFAHLFEHLMFNGSENFNDDFFKATKQIGATNQNGTTNTDRTNYYQTVPREGLDSVLWLESDRMGYLLGAVDQARLDEQRGVVQNEKRQGENQPYGKVWNHIVAATYPEEHPYGHTVIGSMDDLNAATLEDVHEWFKTWYGPSNAVLVLAGNITPEEAKTKVEKYFAELPPGPPVSHPKSWVPTLSADQREVMYDRVPQPRVYKIWAVPELGHPDGELLDAYAYALAGDRNSRLEKRLVTDEQIATSVSVYNSQSELAGQFMVSVTAKPDADLDYIEQAINEEMAVVMEAGPSLVSLEKLKVSTMRSLVDSLERAPAKAATLATWEVYTGDAGGWKTSNDRLMAATPASVKAAAEKWLKDRGSYTLTVKPFDDYKAGDVKADRSTMPLPGSVADAQFPGFEETTLSNGIRLLVAERRDVPRIDMQMLVDTGIGADFASLKPGVAGLSVGLLTDGTTTRSGSEIADEMISLGAGVSSGGGSESATVSMSALTMTLDPALEIFADVVRNPAYRAEDFERERDRYVQGLKQGLAQPNSIAGRVLSQKVWGEDHPYGVSATPESAMEITREEVAAFHEKWFGPNNATLIVVGDTTLDEAKTKLEAAFGDWDVAPGQSVDVSPGQAPEQAKVYLIDRPGSLQSVILAGRPIGPLTAEGNFKQRLFNSALGGSFTSRVNMNLREDKGWSYGARTSLGGGDGPRTFVVSAPVQTDATQDALEELRKELTGIVGSNMQTSEELESQRKDAILGLSSRWETSNAVAASLSGIVTYGFPDDYFQNYSDSLRAVTLDDVHAAAKEVIPDQNFVWVIVGDLEKIEAGVRETQLGEVIVVDELGQVVR